MVCKFKQYKIENGAAKLMEYTCNDIETLKKEFRKMNGTDQILKEGGKDRAYERYSEQLDNQCKCDEVSLICKKCPLEEHENTYFCRCEGRNIKVAKELRKRGLNGWQNGSTV